MNSADAARVGPDVVISGDATSTASAAEQHDAPKQNGSITPIELHTQAQEPIPVAEETTSQSDSNSPEEAKATEEEKVDSTSKPIPLLTSTDESSNVVASLATNGNSPIPSPREEEDRDIQAEAMVISSLRTQVQDLFSQVTQLNAKLVRSYDRVSDLEDDVHIASANARSSALRIAQLELERTQHLSALNTGLLVERSAVTAELSRVMERATVEAARAGKAETAKEEIERELDDLSAGLFNQANNMVAQARYAQASSERKVEESAAALRAAEDAVSVMQAQVQTLQEEKDKALADAERIQMRMGKGKWIERESLAPSPNSVRLLSSHNPYQEFLLFVAHLRSIRPSTSQPPAMQTLIQLPFLARLQMEDSDPTVRLDLAPSLNWLSRRSVLGAIHNGELTIEPMTATLALEELGAPNYSSAAIMTGGVQPQNISCALCGTSIFPALPTTPGSPQPPLHPAISSRTNSNSASWSTSIFKTALSTTTGTNNSTNMLSPGIPGAHHAHLYQERPYPTRIFIFRITAQPGATGQTTTKSMYPLCTSGWCLARLRTTCSLWAFVRAALVERVWEEEAPNVLHTPAPKRPSREDSVGSLIASVLPTVGSGGEKPAESDTRPPVPPRKSKIGGFWGRASSAISASVAQVSRSATLGSTNGTPAPEEKSERQTPTSPQRPPLPQRNTQREALPVVPPPRLTRATPNATDHAAPLELPATHPHSDAGSTTLFDASVDHDDHDDHDKSTDIPSTPTAPPAGTNVSPAKPNGGVASEITATTTEPATASAPPDETTTTENAQPILPTVSPRVPNLAPPSRTASPAPAPLLPPRAVARTASPAPGATGTPPPIPRRAAARGSRPLSMAIQIANGTGTNTPDAPASPITTARVSTPVEGTPTAPSTADAPASDDSPTGKPDTMANSVETVPPPPATAPGLSEAPVATVADMTETEAVLLVNNSLRAASPKSDVFATPAEEHVPDLAKDAHLGQNSEPAIPEPTATEKAPSPPHKPAPLPLANGDDKPQDLKVSAQEEPAEDGEIYVGEATWEERAWKELARLREDMFWARVGGVR